MSENAYKENIPLLAFLAGLYTEYDVARLQILGGRGLLSLADTLFRVVKASYESDHELTQVDDFNHTDGSAVVYHSQQGGNW